MQIINGHMLQLLRKKNVKEGWLQRLRYYQTLMQESEVEQKYIDKFEKLIVFYAKHSINSVNYEFYFFFRGRGIFYPMMKACNLGDYFVRLGDHFPEKPQEETSYRIGYLRGMFKMAELLKIGKTEAEGLAKEHKAWLQEQIDKYGDHVPETEEDGICYRRGFEFGMGGMANLLNVAPEENVRLCKPFRHWRRSWLFRLDTPPGEAECDNLPEPLKKILVE